MGWGFGFRYASFMTLPILRSAIPKTLAIYSQFRSIGRVSARILCPMNVRSHAGRAVGFYLSPTLRGGSFSRSLERNHDFQSGFIGTLPRIRKRALGEITCC